MFRIEIQWTLIRKNNNQDIWLIWLLCHIQHWLCDCRATQWGFLLAQLSNGASKDLQVCHLRLSSHQMWLQECEVRLWKALSALSLLRHCCHQSLGVFSVNEGNRRLFAVVLQGALTVSSALVGDVCISPGHSASAGFPSCLKSCGTARQWQELHCEIRALRALRWIP